MRSNICRSHKDIATLLLGEFSYLSKLPRSGLFAAYLNQRLQPTAPSVAAAEAWPLCGQRPAASNHRVTLIDVTFESIGAISNQSQMGDMVYVELPDVGMRVEQGGVFRTLESVKAVTEFYAPVSCAVRSVKEGEGLPRASQQRPVRRRVAL